jgi:hypothetical protein
MPLTDTAVRQARPRERVYRLNDGRGLVLLIQPNGSKWCASDTAGKASSRCSQWARIPILPCWRHEPDETWLVSSSRRESIRERRGERAEIRWTEGSAGWLNTGWRDSKNSCERERARARHSRKPNGLLRISSIPRWGPGRSIQSVRRNCYPF